MRLNKIFSVLSLLAVSSVNASRSDFYGENDNRPTLFKILDDHVAQIKINLDEETWTTMKQKTVLKPWDAGANGEKYGTQNATMDFSVEGTDYRVELQPGEFTFVLGGKGSRNFGKPGYNIKFEKGSELYDVKLLRLRANVRDLSLMREKLSTDFLYKMGVPSTSTNYANVEVNGENLGIFVISNKVKKDFIEKYYGEKSTNNLYECKKDYARFEDESIVRQCINTKDELAEDTTEMQKLVDAVNQAKTIADIEDIVDVDSILKTFAFEFLTLSWDHFFILGHNYFWYKRPDNGKWMMILNDFDETWAQDIWSNYFTDNTAKFVNKTYIPDLSTLNLPNFSVRDLESGHKLVKLLILDDDTRWREVLGDIVKNAFNPKLLNPRVDEIAELIRKDVSVSREIDESTGHAKGFFNTLGWDTKWTMEQFDTGNNYDCWASEMGQSRSYGLKFFIEERFKYVCHTYGIDPETLELIQPRPAVSFWGIINKYKTRNSQGNNHKFDWPDLDLEDYKQESYNAEPEKHKGPENYTYALTIHDIEEMNAANNDGSATTTDVPSATTVVTAPTETSAVEECWSESLGYSCCTSTCHVIETDADGAWGYENQEWCGIPSNCQQEKCWSKKFGYACCEGCEVYETDADGAWGYENENWCGVIEEKCN